jgi:hypothetical protein
VRYEFKFLDKRGRVAHLNEVDVPDDMRALHIARSLRSAHHIEIYRGDEQVGRVEPQAKS